MKEIVLHCGFHKTGSSSIQQSLAANSGFLNDNGVHYLEFTDLHGNPVVNHSMVFFSLFCDDPNDYHMNIKNEWNVETANNHYWEQIEDELARHGDRIILISGEDISLLSEAGLRRLRTRFSEYEIRVIAYVREPYWFTCSATQQSIKGGVNALDKLTVAKRVPQVRKIKKVFPHAEFYAFEDLCQGEGPVGHLLTLLDIRQHEQFREVRVNQSISNKLARLGNFINRYEPGMHGNINNRTRQSFNLKDIEFSDGKFLLTRKEFEALKTELKLEAEALSELTGVDVHAPVRLSGDEEITAQEVARLVEKAAGLDGRIRQLIWDYISQRTPVTPELRDRLLF